jgi:hypothetical protein
LLKVWLNALLTGKKKSLLMMIIMRMKRKHAVWKLKLRLKADVVDAEVVQVRVQV